MESYVEFRQIVNNLIRRWWVLVLLPLVGGIGGYAFSQVQTPIYIATATVMVGDFIQAPEISRDDIAAREVFAETYAELARRQPVMDEVVKVLDLDISWRQLKNHVNISIVGNTQLIEVEVEADNPQDAELIAGEIVRQLLILSPNKDNIEASQLFLQQEIESLQYRIESGHNKLLVLEPELTSDLSPDQLRALRSEIDGLKSSITEWEGNYSRLLSLLKPNTSQNRLTIVDEAYANTEPVLPRTSLNIFLGAVVGFVLALGIVLLIDLFDDRVRSPDSLVQKTGLHNLGSIGRMKGKKYEGKLMNKQDPLSGIAESYRMIGRNIEFLTREKPVKTLLVTSPSDDEGKSVTVSNLGVVMAQTGLKTIIVDANLRESVQHMIFEIPNQVGLADLLANSDIKPKEQLKKTGIQNLQVLTSGKLPHDPIGLLSPQKMKKLLDDLGQFSDVIILDVPSVSTTESAILSSLVDALLLVVGYGKTTYTSIEQSISKINLVNSRLLGGILNRSTS